MFLKFNTFKIKKMKYYHDWYLKCNDLLLLYAPYDKSWGWTYFRHIYLLLEKSMKGGVSYIFKTNKQDNKNLKSNDPKQEWKNIYLDENNLYVVFF